eukprot:3251036-Prorocentrum_lima.AAC.1
MCDLRPDADHLANDHASSYSGPFTPTSPSMTSNNLSRSVRSIYRPVRAQPVLNCEQELLARSEQEYIPSCP